MTRRIVLAGGGTGGHIFPLVVMAREMRDLDWEVLFIGSRYGLESKLVPARGFPLKRLPVKGMMGIGGWRSLPRLAMLPLAILMACGFLLSYRPSVVFSSGGYASFPTLLSSRFLRIPYLLLEQNAYPGKVTRMFSSRSHTTFLGFSAAGRHLEGTLVKSGNPVRETIFSVKPLSDTGPPYTLLVLGGSQGSHFLNRMMIQKLPSMGHLPLQILHQSGPREYDDVVSAYRDSGIQHSVVPFIDDMREAFEKAHLVISRSGAMSVSEVAASGRPAIFIPFSKATHDHQTENARALRDTGGSWLLSENEARGDALTDLVSDLIHDPDKLVRAGSLVRTHACPDAASTIRQGILRAAGCVPSKTDPDVPTVSPSTGKEEA